MVRPPACVCVCAGWDVLFCALHVRNNNERAKCLNGGAAEVESELEGRARELVPDVRGGGESLDSTTQRKKKEKTGGGALWGGDGGDQRR